MSGLSRRGMLGLLGGVGLLAGAAGCSGGGGGSGDVSLRFAWWGNDLRNRMTSEALALYRSEQAGVSIVEEPAQFSAYWDRMATQTAGRDAPDLIQMADGYIADYGTRGALLDLTDLVDVSTFTEGTVETGVIDGKLVGINAGINTPSVLCNTAVLAAAGVDIPDDTTWTWDGYRDLSAAISAATGADVVGSASPFSEGTLRAWLRQHGEELFTTEGQVGATEETLRGYFEMTLTWAQARAIPEPATIVEESTVSLEQSAFVNDGAGFGLYWSNQYAAVTANTDADIRMLRMPTLTGRPEDLKAWYHPSMLWSASATTAHPEEAGRLIDWLVNSPAAAGIILDERGFPANAATAEAIGDQLSPAGQTIAAFLDDLRPVLGEPQPVPPPGTSTVFADVQARTQDDLFFGRISAADAAAQFFAQATSAVS